MLFHPAKVLFVGFDLDSNSAYCDVQHNFDQHLCFSTGIESFYYESFITLPCIRTSCMKWKRNLFPSLKKNIYLRNEKKGKMFI